MPEWVPGLAAGLGRFVGFGGGIAGGIATVLSMSGDTADSQGGRPTGESVDAATSGPGGGCKDFQNPLACEFKGDETSGDSSGPTENPTVDDVLSGLREGRTVPNKQVSTNDEVHEVYNQLARGGKEINPPATYDGVMTELQDGTRVGLRVDSKSGGDVVDVFRRDGTYVKVHTQ